MAFKFSMGMDKPRQSQSVPIRGIIQSGTGSLGRPIPGIPPVVIENEGKEAPEGEEGDVTVVVDDNDTAGQAKFLGIFDGYTNNTTSKSDRGIRNVGGRRYYITGDRASRRSRRVLLVRGTERRCNQLEWISDRSIFTTQVSSNFHIPLYRSDKIDPRSSSVS